MTSKSKLKPPSKLKQKAPPAKSSKPKRATKKAQAEQEKLQALCRDFQYQFNDINLLITALTHRSKHIHNNERLEFLGDSILGFIIADALYERFPEATEGELSRSRSYLVKGDTLAVLALKLELGDYLRMGPGELKSGGYRRNSILADTFEAIIGAIYLDSDLSQAKIFIFRHYAELLESITLKDAGKDPKTQLQEFLQARKLPLPEYNVVSTSGSAHQQIFNVKCTVEEFNLTANGEGSSRRKGEQAAASLILEQIEKAAAG